MRSSWATIVQPTSAARGGLRLEKSTSVGLVFPVGNQNAHDSTAQCHTMKPGFESPGELGLSAQVIPPASPCPLLELEPMAPSGLTGFPLKWQFGGFPQDRHFGRFKKNEIEGSLYIPVGRIQKEHALK